MTLISQLLRSAATPDSCAVRAYYDSAATTPPHSTNAPLTPLLPYYIVICSYPMTHTNGYINPTDYPMYLSLLYFNLSPLSPTPHIHTPSLKLLKDLRTSPRLYYAPCTTNRQRTPRFNPSTLYCHRYSKPPCDEQDLTSTNQ